ncbi:MAG: quinolinate synthase NadA [Firmicutes bacterium]|nr:quinolinate synthase NadA [Bacillota bacterium]
MFTQLAPNKYQGQMYSQLSDEEIKYKIMEAKGKLGSKLLVLGHHYQHDSVIQFADLKGDSFLLARQAAECKEALYIVFLGVNFMAETADIVTTGEQKVIIPDTAAGCIMADMAGTGQVKQCWAEIQKYFPGEVIPITYVNSSAQVKAFCGENGGLTCTSSSAESAFRWALQKGKRILFFPDEHLGRNAGKKIGISLTDMALWDRHKGLLKGCDNPRLILWNGYCPVHQEFSPQRVCEVRKDHPGIKVVVHPECSYETVEEADESGSTEYIIKCIRESSPGSSWAVGTEINLVQRLADTYKDKKIISLNDKVRPCPDMMKIHPRNLLCCLENLVSGKVENQVKVDLETAGWAKVALQRMLSIR